MLRALLVVLGALGEAGGCLPCLSSGEQRLRLCRLFLGAASREHVRCLRRLRQVYAPLDAVAVGVPAVGRLREALAQGLQRLEEQGEAGAPYERSLDGAVAWTWQEVAKIPPAPACVPPCGYQQDAQVYKCAVCRIVDCQLPLDCPVEDVWREEGDRVSLRCSLPFPTPPDVVATWGFAKDVRSQDLSLFGEQGVAGGLAQGLVIRSAQASQRGTFVCQLHAGAQLLARRYFYLNGAPDVDGTPGGPGAGAAGHVQGGAGAGRGEPGGSREGQARAVGPPGCPWLSALPSSSAAGPGAGTQRLAGHLAAGGSAVLAVDGVMDLHMDRNKLSPPVTSFSAGGLGRLGSFWGRAVARPGDPGVGGSDVSALSVKGRVHPAPWKFPRGAPPRIPQDVLVWTVTSGRGIPFRRLRPLGRSGAAWPEQRQQRPGLQQGAEDPGV